MPDPRWWFERLRAMSLGEVVHRSVRLARYPIDLAAARAGIYGRPSRHQRVRLARWRGPEAFVFSETTARAPLSSETRAVAEAYLLGRQTVLGLGDLALPDEPWHFEPRAGGFWPVIDARRVVASAPADFDPRITWELNRGHGWVMLARVYAATRELRFRNRLVRELRSWRRTNPVGVGINWVSAMEAAIRIHSLSWIAALLRGDGDAAAWPLLAELLFQHGAFVARNLSRFSSANNHLIVELSGLAVAGRVLDIACWRDHALRALAREAERQTFPDGVNIEMATHYHMFVLEALLLVSWLERAHRTPARTLEEVIARMAAYLDAITLRSGIVLHQGDNDDGKLLPLFADQHAEQLLCAARALTVAPARAAADCPAPGEGALLLCDGAPCARIADSPRSRWFGDAGQVVLRGARLHAAFDAGPFGFGTLAAHAHCDALAVTVAFDDRPLLVERGTYRYNGDREARDRYRSTAAHNTVQLGAREQGDAVGPFLWSRKPVAVIEHCEIEVDAADVVRARHDGFAPARHVRTLVRLGDSLAVVDEIRDALPGEPVIARWHLAPRMAVVDLAEGFVTVRDGAGSLPDRWLWFGCGDLPLRARVRTTLHSSRYLEQEPACTLEVELPDVRDRLVMVVGADARGREDELRRISGAWRAAAGGGRS
jgi:heparinase II/III-like protein